MTRKISQAIMLDMLTQKDVDEIRQIVREEIDEKTKHLPTKDEFYTKMDELMGEVKAMREEQGVYAGQYSNISDELENHDTRIKKLEKHTGISP